MDDCSAEYAKIKIVLLRWARVSVPIWAGYVGQRGGQGAHLDKIWQMYWQPVHHRGRGTAIQHRLTCVCLAWNIQCNIIQGFFSRQNWMIGEKLFDKVFLLNFLNYSEFNRNLTVTLFLYTCVHIYIYRIKLSLCCRVDFSTKFDWVKVARQRQWRTAPNDQRIPARILRHLYISDNLLLNATISKSNLLFCIIRTRTVHFAIFVVYLWLWPSSRTSR